MFAPTWSHKNSYLCALFSETVVTYLTASFAAVSKRNVHWVALKHTFNTWTCLYYVQYFVLYLYYVHIGTYCFVFIKLLRERIAAVQNTNIRGPLLKNLCSIVLEICHTPNLNLHYKKTWFFKGYLQVVMVLFKTIALRTLLCQNDSLLEFRVLCSRPFVFQICNCQSTSLLIFWSSVIQLHRLSTHSQRVNYFILKFKFKFNFKIVTGCHVLIFFFGHI